MVTYTLAICLYKWAELGQRLTMLMSWISRWNTPQMQARYIDLLSNAPHSFSMNEWMNSVIGNDFAL